MYYVSFVRTFESMLIPMTTPIHSHNSEPYIRISHCSYSDLHGLRMIWHIWTVLKKRYSHNYLINLWRHFDHLVFSASLFSFAFSARSAFFQTHILLKLHKHHFFLLFSHIFYNQQSFPYGRTEVLSAPWHNTNRITEKGPNLTFLC